MRDTLYNKEACVLYLACTWSLRSLLRKRVTLFWLNNEK